MSRRLRLTVLGAGYLNITRPTAGIAPSGFAEIARVAQVVTLRSGAGRDYRAPAVANELAFETFCCEVKHHG
jgi:hypothetical protein